MGAADLAKHGAKLFMIALVVSTKIAGEVMKAINKLIAERKNA